MSAWIQPCVKEKAKAKPESSTLMQRLRGQQRSKRTVTIITSIFISMETLMVYREISSAYLIFFFCIDPMWFYGHILGVRDLSGLTGSILGRPSPNKDNHFFFFFLSLLFSLKDDERLQ